MNDYAPSWVQPDEVPETPPEERYGSGTDFHDDSADDDRTAGSASNQTDLSQDSEKSSNYDPDRDPRHPRMHVMAGEQSTWVGEIVTPDVHRCGGGYTIVERYDELHIALEEGASANVGIFGIREGDTDDADFTVQSVDVTRDGGFLVTYRYDGGELPALDRWLDEGCLLCRDGGSE